jgi:hypothetical protein
MDKPAERTEHGKDHPYGNQHGDDPPDYTGHSPTFLFRAETAARRDDSLPLHDASSVGSAQGAHVGATGQIPFTDFSGESLIQKLRDSGVEVWQDEKSAAYLNQSQVLAATTGITTTGYLYGQDTAPLTALTGGTRMWYGIDGQGSVRQSLNDSGTVLGVANYDPFGQIEAGSSLTGPFGYTGELQDATTGQEYLRARWYQPNVDWREK